MTSSGYHSVIISDHAPLSLNINSQAILIIPHPYILPLSDDAFSAFIESSIVEFVTTNKHDSILLTIMGIA